MSGFRGDFLGFTYGTKPNGTPMHSSDLGIVRTSNGSRFNENLLPTTQDKTVQVPGGDGTYYFGSYYTQRQISVPFAFDALTEKKLQDLRAHFGDKQIHDLVFDEAPYKTYRAKVTGTAQIKHLAFDEEIDNTEERVYKGEGTIQFTCYQPYAICRHADLSDEYYTENEIYKSNMHLWKEASRLEVSPWPTHNFFNAGDIECPFWIQTGFNESGHFKIEGVGAIEWEAMTKQNADDAYVVIDSRLGLAEGWTADGQRTGSIYNQYVTRWEINLLPVGLVNIITKNCVYDCNFYYF